MKRLLSVIFIAVFTCLSCHVCLADEKINIRFLDNGNYLDEKAITGFYTEFYRLAQENNYTKPTDFYTAGFVNGSVPDIEDKNRTNILILGSVHDVDTEKLKIFDYIFASQEDLSYFLDGQGIKSYYLPQFIEGQLQPLSLCVKDASANGCYFLIIGEAPSLLFILQANQVPYKHIEKFTPEITKDIKSDLAHISGIIFDHTTFFENSNDIDPTIFYAIDYGIPILAASPIAFTEQFDTKPMFRLAKLFANSLSYYSYNSDIDYFFTSSSNRVEKAKLAQKTLAYLYSSSVVARHVFQIITQDKGFVYPLQNTLNVMLTIFPGIYNNGDYWIASDLAQSLQNNYAETFISFPNSPVSKLGDVFIYLRGGRVLHENLVKNDSVSLLYLFYSLSPDKQDIPSIEDYIQQFLGEFKNVDAVATASKTLADALRFYDIEAYYIPQFTNISKFYPDYDENVKSEVLFVGNYSTYRQAVPILLKAQIPVSIYGDAWPNEVLGRYVDNRVLRKYYSSARIVLNDTRADMRELGFISNRIFDATACETLVISDYMKEIEEVYGDTVPMWKTEDELVALVKYYLDPEHEEERLLKAKRAREITLNNFTSDKAAEKFQAIINDVKQKKGLN